MYVITQSKKSWMIHRNIHRYMDIYIYIICSLIAKEASIKYTDTVQNQKRGCMLTAQVLSRSVLSYSKTCRESRHILV